MAAYLLGYDRMRRFLARFREASGRRFLWFWKLEFHEDGYAHWHMLIEYESIQGRVQLAPPGVVNISQQQAEELQDEHSRFAGLAGIPQNAAYAA
jgi:hypothetical protein